jgi:hypothetical protein
MGIEFHYQSDTLGDHWDFTPVTARPSRARAAARRSLGSLSMASRPGLQGRPFPLQGGRHVQDGAHGRVVATEAKHSPGLQQAFRSERAQKLRPPNSGITTIDGALIPQPGGGEFAGAHQAPAPDQFGPFYTKVIAATASEAPHVLDGAPSRGR